MRTIRLGEVQSFVKHGLRVGLRTDLRKLKILREAEVECCAYYHLRRFSPARPKLAGVCAKVFSADGLLH